MTDDNLKPCPRCGGEAFVVATTWQGGHESYWVTCLNIDCDTRTNEYSTREEAIKAWNEMATMNGYEYPSDKVLYKIRNWSIYDPEGLLEYIRKNWYYSHAVTISDDGIEWEFVTGGWSGDEALIRAFRENKIMWMLLWYSSTASGVHKFVLETRTKKDTCEWTEYEYFYDSDNSHWITECGEEYAIEHYGTPATTGMAYCPFCGKRIKEIPIGAKNEKPLNYQA